MGLSCYLQSHPPSPMSRTALSFKRLSPLPPVIPYLLALNGVELSLLGPQRRSGRAGGAECTASLVGMALGGCPSDPALRSADFHSLRSCVIPDGFWWWWWLLLLLFAGLDCAGFRDSMNSQTVGRRCFSSPALPPRSLEPTRTRLRTFGEKRKLLKDDLN